MQNVIFVIVLLTYHVHENLYIIGLQTVDITVQDNIKTQEWLQ